MKRFRFSIPDFLSLILIVGMSFLAAFRGDTFDTQNYRDIYNNIDWIEGPVNIWNKYYIEYGFIIFNNIIKIIAGENVIIYFFVATFFSLCLFYKSAKLLKVDTFESILILSGTYFPLLYLIQMRQGVAISLAIFAVCLYYKKRSLVQFIIIALISISIHLSTLLFILAGFIYPWYEKNNKNYIGNIKIFFFSLTASFFIVYIFRNIGIDKFDYYITNYDEAVDLMSLTNIKYYTLLIVLLIIYNKNGDNNFKFLLYFITLNVGFRVGLYEIFVLSGRLTSIFSIIEIFTIPMIIKNLKINYYFGLFFVFIYSLLSAYYILFLKYNHIIELY